MRKRDYLRYIRAKYIQLTAQYLTELRQGTSLALLKALNGVLTSLAREKAEYETTLTKDIVGKGLAGNEHKGVRLRLFYGFIARDPIVRPRLK